MNETLLKKCGRSLAGKLIITLGFLIAVGDGLSWYMLIKNGRNILMENAVEYTSSYSDLVKKSTRHSMLTFHRDAIQKTIGSPHISLQKSPGLLQRGVRRDFLMIQPLTAGYEIIQERNYMS